MTRPPEALDDDIVICRPRHDPSQKRIASAQAVLLATLDVGDPLHHCWACGDERKLERAHIVPHGLSGSNDPSNYFLLCKQCHKQQPDGATHAAQIIWLRSQPSAIDRLFTLVQEALAPITKHPRYEEWCEREGLSAIAYARKRCARTTRAEGIASTVFTEIQRQFLEWVGVQLADSIAASLRRDPRH